MFSNTVIRDSGGGWKATASQFDHNHPYRDVNNNIVHGTGARIVEVPTSSSPAFQPPSPSSSASPTFAASSSRSLNSSANPTTPSLSLPPQARLSIMNGSEAYRRHDLLVLEGDSGFGSVPQQSRQRPLNLNAVPPMLDASSGVAIEAKTTARKRSRAKVNPVEKIRRRPLLEKQQKAAAAIGTTIRSGAAGLNKVLVRNNYDELRNLRAGSSSTNYRPTNAQASTSTRADNTWVQVTAMRSEGATASSRMEEDSSWIIVEQNRSEGSSSLALLNKRKMLEIEEGRKVKGRMAIIDQS